MSPEIALIGCKSAGHDACPPVPVTEGAENVRAAGRAVVRQGDPLEPHGCSDHNPHQGMVADGAPHIRIGGRAVARKNDPVACGPAQDRLAEGLPCVRAGNCGGEDYGRELAFGMLTDPDTLLVRCLPEMVANEAERTREQGNSIDHQGWLYLHEGVLKWAHGKAAVMPDEKGHNGCQSPLWVEWSWLMQYKRFRDAVEELKRPEYLFSEAAKANLTRFLQEEKAFTGNGQPFDHIAHPKLKENEKEVWETWRKHAIQGKTMAVYQWPDNWDEFWDVGKNAPQILDETALLHGQIKPDALLVVVGNTTIYAVTSGRTKLYDGRWHVVVEKVAFFIHDGFDFNGDQKLGWWLCSEPYVDPGSGEMVKGFKMFDIHGFDLENKDFRRFRDATGYGCDFRTMCVPEVVITKGYEYYVS